MGKGYICIVADKARYHSVFANEYGGIWVLLSTDRVCPEVIQAAVHSAYDSAEAGEVARGVIAYASYLLPHSDDVLVSPINSDFYSVDDAGLVLYVCCEAQKVFVHDAESRVCLGEIPFSEIPETDKNFRMEDVLDHIKDGLELHGLNRDYYLNK